jgi:hypothetical protein
MLTREVKGKIVPGGLVHPYIDIEVSLLLNLFLETYATLSKKTTTWLEWEAIPFCRLHIKDIVRNVWDLPLNPVFELQGEEATNMIFV